MSNLNITKTGQLITDLNNIKFMINNFAQSDNTSGWSLGGSPVLSGDKVTLTGVNPTISSINFIVNPTDIICVEFGFALPTPSSPDGADKGVYLGTRYGQAVYLHTFDQTTKKWNKATSTTTNPYFLHAYNLTNKITLKNYILGSDVDLNDVPWGNSTNTTYPARAVQLPSGTTETNLRSGYNTNSSMIIEFYNPKVYNITQQSFYDGNEITYGSFGKNFVNGFQIIEY